MDLTSLIEHLPTIASAFGGGTVGGTLGSIATMRYADKLARRTALLEVRREKIERWRSALKKDDAYVFELINFQFYPELRPHLSRKLVRVLEDPKRLEARIPGELPSISGKSARTLLNDHVLDEIAKLEIKWGLI